MLKGILKDDEWGPFKPAMKDGVTLMMMGTAELPTAPAQKTIFAEDLPEEERDSALNNLPPGLVNLDNTCYFNSTVQVLAGVPELNKTIAVRWSLCN
jgi:ubiquitin carboxyl-terminal hydrolase 14